MVKINFRIYENRYSICTEYFCKSDGRIKWYEIDEEWLAAYEDDKT